jgi:glycosyltransferase involved in cell wall biosynthesis
MTKYSVIIPVKEINDYVRETARTIIESFGVDWELLIVTNEEEKSEWDDNRIKIVSSGKVGPADKRDLGAAHCEGSILVFLDDDSYPSPNYYKALERLFANDSLVAVGGPGVTPPSNSFGQKVSGAVFLSRFTGGVPERYLPVGRPRYVNDWPSVNLVVRKSIFQLVGGFNCNFWPGEDTYFCRKLDQSGYKILYAPDLIVFHHRRNGLFRHLKQVGTYGLHRGYFSRVFPSTSRRIQYFIPSGIVGLFLIALLMPLLPSTISRFITVGLAVYVIVTFAGIVQVSVRSTITIGVAALPYVFLSHFAYGVCFLRGIFKSQPPTPRLR